MSGPGFAPRLVIFDLDGVVYRGPQAVDGAPALIAALRAAGIVVRFGTNNSMATRASYVDRLAGHGISARADEVVTSTSATVAHLARHLPEARRVLAVGAQGMVDELRAAELDVTPVAEGAPPEWDGGPLPSAYDVVVAGLDQGFDYRRLGIAATAIRGGARFIATNADRRYPTPDGFVPGAGAVVAAIAAASETEPLVIGKPQPTMFEGILEEAGIAATESLVIGDNPDADVVAARRAGIRSLLVLTGVTDRTRADRLDGDRRPDAVASDPQEAAELLGVSLGA